jgi:hypothetical protein
MFTEVRNNDQINIKTFHHKLDVAAHNYNPSSKEIEAGGS